MEESEVPLEEVHEHIHHHAASHGHDPVHQPGGPRPAPERWTMGVALSTALFAALAAISSLIAGGQANEAMRSQIESSDQWNYYQAKSIKSNLLDTKIEMLTALGHDPSPKDLAKRKDYEVSKDEIAADAKAKQAEAETELANHERMATAVTMFQVAIALGAIAVLTKLRLFWFVSITLGALGAYAFASGLVAISSAQGSATQTSSKRVEAPVHAGNAAESRGGRTDSPSDHHAGEPPASDSPAPKEASVPAR